MATKRRKPHGVFCLEGEWWNNMKEPSSVEPLFELLLSSPYRVPFIHRNADTLASMKVYLGKWTQTKYADYPILYLAFHGGEGGVYLGDLRRADCEVKLDDLEEFLKGKCKGRIIHFGSCSTLGLHGRRLSSFLRRTGALAVCGYEGQIDWLESAAFELLEFAAMQGNALTLAGARAMRDRIYAGARQLCQELRFRMVVGERAANR